MPGPAGLIDRQRLAALCLQNNCSVLDICKLSAGLALGTFLASKEVCLGAVDVESSICEVCHCDLEILCDQDISDRGLSMKEIVKSHSLLGEKNSSTPPGFVANMLKVLHTAAHLFDVAVVIHTKPCHGQSSENGNVSHSKTSHVVYPRKS